MQLNFVQSNWLRQYPFRGGHGVLDLYNNVVPTDLIVALRITCKANDLELFISKIVTNNGIVSISFDGANGPVGSANGTVSMSNQSLLIHDTNNGVIGNVTIGNIDSVKDKQAFVFDSSNGLVEPSTVMVMGSPGVTSINVKGKKITGAVKLSSNTVSITTNGSINLNVIKPTEVQSRNDISAETLTCGNTIVSGINTVTPDEHGNINIYTILPVVVTTSDNTINLDSPSTPLSKICKVINLPPADNTQTSHQSISTITNPEWSTWPQYQ